VAAGLKAPADNARRSQMFKFESTCGNCKTRITSKDGGASWRHDKAPVDKHHAYASGDMRQI
jgi:hypothetical protein